MIPETLKQSGNLILTILVLGIVIFFVVEVFFNVKVGRGVCKIVAVVVGSALGALGFGTGFFVQICDRLPF